MTKHSIPDEHLINIRLLKAARENLRLRRIERSAIIFLAHVSGGLIPASQVSELIPRAERKSFVEYIHPVLEGSSKTYRDRALILTFCLLGFHPNLIAEFMGCSNRWPRRLLKRWKQGDRQQLLSRPKRSSKYDDPQIKGHLFKTLHSPPSTYGINRTTWTIDLLHDVLLDEGTLIGKNGICKIIRAEGYSFRKTREVLTSNDPDYQEKLKAITRTLRRLGPMDRFFSIDEYGPVSVRERGGRLRVRRGEKPTVPQYQDSKGRVIVTAALELCSNQITHFYSKKKDTEEMIRLLHALLDKYWDCRRLYLSWDAASWHSSRAFLAEVKRVNKRDYRNTYQSPMIKVRPLPARAQFLNVIESVFSGLSQSVIHNSNYQSEDEMRAAIDRYIAERNEFFRVNQKKAGNKIWGEEQVPAYFSVSHNCKNPKFMEAASIR